MEEVGSVAARVAAVWLALVLALIVLPSALGVSLGISEAYMRVLVKTLEVGGAPVPSARCPPSYAESWEVGAARGVCPAAPGDSKMASAGPA